MKTLFAVLRIFAFLAFTALFFRVGVLQAQEVVGVSEILDSTNASEIDTYSATELSYDASLYYGAYVEGYLFENGNTIAAGSAQNQQNAYGYMSKPLTVGDDYELDSYHYLVLSYAYTDGGNYYYDNPYGYDYTEGGGGGGETFEPGTGETYVTTQYLYLGGTYVVISSAPPQISNVYPTSGARGTSGTITVDGQHLLDVFTGGTTAAISGSGVSLSTGSLTDTEVTLNYSIDSAAAAGTDTLTVSTRFGTSNGVSFSIGDNGPVITSVSPAGGNQGDAGLQVTISGSGFGTSPSVQISGDGVSVNVLSASDSQIVANVNIDGGASLGDRQVTVTANGPVGQGFTSVPGGASGSTTGTFTVGSGGSYKLNPAKLNLSTGDTNKSISITNNNNISMSGIAYTPLLLNNPSSSCAATLNFQNGQSSSTVVTAGNSPCSGVFDINAAVNFTTTNDITVVVPPQPIVQVLWGEANIAVGYNAVQARVLMETLANTIGQRVNDPAFGSPGSWQAAITTQQFGGYATGQSIVDGPEPELTAASNVFTQALPINNVPNATCFFSPSSAGWTAIKQAMNQNATTVPTVAYDPGCYESPSISGAQFVIKSSTGTFPSGLPFFIFIRPKQPTDLAVVQIP